MQRPSWRLSQAPCQMGRWKSAWRVMDLYWMWTRMMWRRYLIIRSAPVPHQLQMRPMCVCVCVLVCLWLLWLSNSRQTHPPSTAWRTWPRCSISMSLAWCTPWDSATAVTWCTPTPGPTWWSLTPLAPPPCTLKRCCDCLRKQITQSQSNHMRGRLFNLSSCFPRLFKFLSGDADVQGLQEGGHGPSHLQHGPGRLQEPPDHSPRPVHRLDGQKWKRKDHQLPAHHTVPAHCRWQRQQNLFRLVLKQAQDMRWKPLRAVFYFLAWHSPCCV